MGVLEKYRLIFYTKEVLGNKVKLADSELPAYKYISDLLSDRKFIYMDETIDEVNQVINGQLNEAEDGDESGMFMLVGPTNTSILASDNLDLTNPDLVIPTVDWRDILIEWKKFLETQQK